MWFSFRNVDKELQAMDCRIKLLEKNLNQHCCKHDVVKFNSRPTTSIWSPIGTTTIHGYDSRSCDSCGKTLNVYEDRKEFLEAQSKHYKELAKKEAV